jgi:GNAT superfamily N-acetyltransferase
MSAITTLVANLGKPEHQQAILALLNVYAQDPMGDGKPLSDEVQQRLIPGLQAHPTTLVVLAFRDTEPVGMAICFRGFSTFAARPLLNIHDFVVLDQYRGQGIGRRVMDEVEAQARRLGCCKLTLEVQENNRRARAVYAAIGFQQSVHVAKAGGALFLSKPL